MNILLITATLNPPANMPSLVRKDPSVRLHDYVSALRFYLSLLGVVIDRIIFAENSNANVDELEAVVCGHESNVEFLSFDGMDHPASYGRGYAEFKLLDHAMTNSRTVLEASSEAKFWKVTGRYRVVNLPAIIRRAPSSFKVYVDLRRYPVRWFDTRLMAWTREGYRSIFHGNYRQLREDILHVPSEMHLYTLLISHLGVPGFVPRFTVQPRVDGIRGYDNRNYNAGTNLLKYHIRRVIRRFLPWVWV